VDGRARRLAGYDRFEGYPRDRWEVCVSSSPAHSEPAWDSELSSPNYEIFIGMVSLLSLLNMVLYFVVGQADDLRGVLRFMNFFLSGIFLCDFGARMLASRARADYFFRRFGWADLLGCVPLHSAKMLRLFRVVRIYRVIGKYGPSRLWAILTRDRAGSSLFLMLLLGILVTEFGSLAILRVEKHAPGANISNASDALWYVIETISTVGYGDKFPVTNLGRIVGSVIIVIGVGIFGTFTGYLANFFIAPSRGTASATGDAG
jgi:voltage-gated potassium channel